MDSIVRNESGLIIAGICECGKAVSDADGSLEWANRFEVFCSFCA